MALRLVRNTPKIRSFCIYQSTPGRRIILCQLIADYSEGIVKYKNYFNVIVVMTFSLKYA